MGQPVVHFELWSNNPEQVSEFYSKIFGWSINYIPELNYRFVETGGDGIDGGIFQPQEGPWPGNMCLYINVDSLEEYLDRVKEAGGKVVVERAEVPNIGAFALFEDPDGRVLGIWQQS